MKKLLLISGLFFFVFIQKTMAQTIKDSTYSKYESVGNTLVKVEYTKRIIQNDVPFPADLIAGNVAYFLNNKEKIIVPRNYAESFKWPTNPFWLFTFQDPLLIYQGYIIQNGKWEKDWFNEEHAADFPITMILFSFFFILFGLMFRSFLPALGSFMVGGLMACGVCLSLLSLIAPTNFLENIQHIYFMCMPWLFFWYIGGVINFRIRRKYSTVGK